MTSYGIDDGEVECRDGGITRIVLNFDMRTYTTAADEMAAGDLTLSSGSVTSVVPMTHQPEDSFPERYIVNLSGVVDDQFSGEGEW